MFNALLFDYAIVLLVIPANVDTLDVKKRISLDFSGIAISKITVRHSARAGVLRDCVDLRLNLKEVE